MISFLIVLLLISILAIIFLPKYEINQSGFNNSLERKNLENELRRTTIQLIGGILLVVGAYISWNTYTQTKERDLAEQINKTITLMGNDKDYVKIGAIYSLNQITENYKNSYNLVQNILTSYMRDHAKWTNVDYSSNIELRQSILIALNNIREHNSKTQIDLSGIDLRDLILKSINLKNINFVESHFNSSDLKGSNFDNSVISGSTFNNANLENTSFINCDLRYSSLKKATILNANFSGADLRGIQGYNKQQIMQQAITDKNTKFE